jgi:hypothetical protein
MDEVYSPTIDRTPTLLGLREQVVGVDTRVILATTDQLDTAEIEQLLALNNDCFPAQNESGDGLFGQLGFSRGYIIGFGLARDDPGRIVSMAALSLFPRISTVDSLSQLGVFNASHFATDPDYRERGYLSAVLSVLLTRGAELFPSYYLKAIDDGRVRPSGVYSEAGQEIQVDLDRLRASMDLPHPIMVLTYHPYLINHLGKWAPTAGFWSKPQEHPLIGQILERPFFWFDLQRILGPDGSFKLDMAIQASQPALITVNQGDPIPSKIDYRTEIAIPSETLSVNHPYSIRPHTFAQTVIAEIKNNPLFNLPLEINLGDSGDLTVQYLGEPNVFDPRTLKLAIAEIITRLAVEAGGRPPKTYNYEDTYRMVLIKK